MDNLNIRNFESIGQLTGALEQVISGDQPLQRALTVLRDNTQPGVFSEKLSAKEREEALAEPDYQLLTRLGHEFAPENSTLAVQKDKESTMQAVYQQLTELHRYLLAIQNAPVPGKADAHRHQRQRAAQYQLQRAVGAVPPVRGRTTDRSTGWQLYRAL